MPLSTSLLFTGWDLYFSLAQCFLECAPAPLQASSTIPYSMCHTLRPSISFHLLTFPHRPSPCLSLQRPEAKYPSSISLPQFKISTKVKDKSLIRITFYLQTILALFSTWTQKNKWYVQFCTLYHTHGKELEIFGDCSHCIVTSNHHSNIRGWAWQMKYPYSGEWSLLLV